jgi:receptor protein-tyrosine kinase
MGQGGQATRVEPASQDWSSIECVQLLYSRRATLARITAAGLLASALISSVQPRLYQSQASLEVQSVSEPSLSLRNLYPTTGLNPDANGAYIQTQVEMLQEDGLIERVVNKLQLDRRSEYEFGRSLWEKLLSIAGPDSVPLSRTRKTVEAVKQNLKILPPRSRIIRIVFDARNPQLAADVANTLAQSFIDQKTEERHRVAVQTQESLNQYRTEARNKLAKSEAELAAFDYPSRGSLRVNHFWLPTEGSSSQKAGLTTYKTLQDEVDTERRFLDTMSQMVNDATVASAVRLPDVRLIGSAQLPAHPYKPNLPLNLAIGLFGGIAFAIGYVLLQEQTNSVLRNPGEAGIHLTVPELGAIPESPTPGPNLRILSPDREPHASRSVLEPQAPVLLESFRATLASILSAAQRTGHPNSFIVTSSQPLEGKTTAVSNLGIALAEIGTKVLLIDGDMRRPRLHTVFNQINSWGLSDVLNEQNAIEELPMESLVKKTAIPNLYIVPSGARHDNIFGLLCSGRMARLLPRFRQEFDYVLVDAPPCLEFADARIMARHADNLLLVVRANYTDTRTAQAAVQRLLLDGIPIMGVILNRCRPMHTDMYGYGSDYNLRQEDRT